MENRREELWKKLREETWDVIVIGGGITGAGILREAVRSGLRAVLVEQRDFAWGTSSRSSKLVHGGLRYLKEGRVGLTLASIQEREQLLRDGPGLVDDLGFLLAIHEGDSPGRWTFELGLTIYDLLALQWDHHYYSPEDFRLLAPRIGEGDLHGGFRYGDAQTDDARLVLRVLREAQRSGGTALNYARVDGLLYDAVGTVCGVRVQDGIGGQAVEARGRAVINATGAWVDGLRGEIGAPARIRPLRGSHLIFPAWRLPVAQAVSFLHPFDGRPVFIFPWESVTLVGTTDVDHGQALGEEPAIQADEVAYLMAAVEFAFPSLEIGLNDVLATFAGVRPVVGSGKLDPSQESRDHVVWDERGLLTVTGGKLTTFRLIAHQALQVLRQRLSDLPELATDQPALDSVSEDCLNDATLSAGVRRRLIGRYGAEACDLAAAARAGELEAIPGTRTLWAELRWAARSEQVCHLDDLLLRRTRLGLFLPAGGTDLMAAVLAVCAEELGWDAARQEQEAAAYSSLWQKSYSLPERSAIPEWRERLAAIKKLQEAKRIEQTRQRRKTLAIAFMVGAAAGILSLTLILRRRAKIAHD